MAIKVNALRCLSCGDEIWSRHRHDFRFCTCGDVHVDGGRDYFKYGWKTDAKFEVIELEIDNPPEEKLAPWPY